MQEKKECKMDAWERAEQRLFLLYGQEPDPQILDRFAKEKQALHLFGVADYFDHLGDVRRRWLADYNERLTVKAAASRCFTAYLLGASELDPLPPHYRCKQCGRVLWVAQDGTFLLDRPQTQVCACGGEMRVTGYGLPWELYLPSAASPQQMERIPYAEVQPFDDPTARHFQASVFDATQFCHMLELETGVRQDDIDLADPAVAKQLLGGVYPPLLPRLTDFLGQLHQELRPQSYGELVQMIGLAHGTQAWKENAEHLLKKDRGALSVIPTTRDAVFRMVARAAGEKGENGVPPAFTVAQHAGQGYYLANGMDAKTRQLLKDLEIDRRAVAFLSGVHYLCGEALVLLELLCIIRATWYQLHCPEAFATILRLSRGES